MFSIEDFAKMDKNGMYDALKEMGVKVPTGTHSAIDLTNFMLKARNGGTLTSKVARATLAEALENGLLLLDGQPYPAKAEAAPAPVQATGGALAVAPVPLKQVGGDNFRGEAEENIARIIKAGATKAIMFTESNNQREKVPIKHNRSRVLYQVGLWLPIEDKFLAVLESTSYDKDMYVTEGGKTVKKTKKVHRFAYRLENIVDRPELAQFHHLVGKKAAA